MTDKVKYFTDNQEKLAQYGKALSHPVRVFILDYLSNNLNKCCYSGDMAEELPIARSTLSEHLKELKNGIKYNGIVPEWSKGAVCKTVMINFIIIGSNPIYTSKMPI